MAEIRYEEAAKEVKEYLAAVETCRKGTRALTKAMEEVVNLLASTAISYDKLIHFPGASQEVVSYYIDSLFRLETFRCEAMPSFRAVWVNNVLRQLDDLEYGARSASAAAKRRREAREKFLKSLQKPSNPFASAVSPERLKKCKDEYLLSSDQFDESYKALNGLRGQTVGVLQAHYFHDHAVMLQKLSDALRLRSTPPPPPPPLHAQQEFNARGVRTPPTGTGGARTGAPAAAFTAHQPHGGNPYAPVRRSYAEDEDAFEEVGSLTSSGPDGGARAARGGAGGRAGPGSSARMSRVGTSGHTRQSSTSGSTSGLRTPPGASDTRLPPGEVTTPVKPQPDSADQRRLSIPGNGVVVAPVAAVFPEAAAAVAGPAGVRDAVTGIPVFLAAPYRQYSYESRPRGGAAPRMRPGPPSQTPDQPQQPRQQPQQQPQPQQKPRPPVPHRLAASPPLTVAGTGAVAGEAGEVGAVSPPRVSSTRQPREAPRPTAQAAPQDRLERPPPSPGGVGRQVVDPLPPPPPHEPLRTGGAGGGGTGPDPCAAEQGSSGNAGVRSLSAGAVGGEEEGPHAAPRATGGRSSSVVRLTTPSVPGSSARLESYVYSALDFAHSPSRGASGGCDGNGLTTSAVGPGDTGLSSGDSGFLGDSTLDEGGTDPRQRRSQRGVAAGGYYTSMYGDGSRGSPQSPAGSALASGGHSPLPCTIESVLAHMRDAYLLDF